MSVVNTYNGPGVAPELGGLVNVNVAVTVADVLPNGSVTVISTVLGVVVSGIAALFTYTKSSKVFRNVFTSALTFVTVSVVVPFPVTDVPGNIPLCLVFHFLYLVH